MTASWNRFRAPGIRLISILTLAAGMAAPAAGASAVQSGSRGAAPAANGASADAAAAAAAGDRKAPVDRIDHAADLVDLNDASVQQLTSLPGVGPATARKIVAGRPYGSVEELARAGVPAKTIRAIAPLVTVAGHGTPPAAAPGAGAGPPIRGAAGPKTARSSRQLAALGAPPPKPKVDLNRASEKELETLPGIGPAAARKIVAARPYALVEDLVRAGLAPEAIAKLAPFATAGPAPVPPTPASVPVAGGIPAKPGPPLPPASATPADALGTPAPAPPAPGMVWANPDSKTYHFPGDRWYGKTRHGRYLTEADAVKAGYRAAKSGPKPPSK